MELQEYLLNLKKVCIAYSGGVDSNFLLHKSIEVLGKDNVLAIMAHGIMVTSRELEQAIVYLSECQVQYAIIEMDALSIEEFRHNDPKRCYYCKKYLMSSIIQKAKELGFEHVLDGKNVDDGKVYRPGGKAASELGIISPLEACGYTKQRIRDESKELGLPTWNKPSNACLASRFPYNTNLTKEMFASLEQAEALLIDHGIIGGRVRIHDKLVRLEVNPSDFTKIIEDASLIKNLKELGYQYITLDLEGYRSGSYDK